MPPKKNTEAIVIKPIGLNTMTIYIKGITPLMTHAWSKKAMKMIEDKQTGEKIRQKKEPRNPEQEFKESMYFCDDGITPGFPAKGIKAAMVAGCAFFDGLTMVKARIMFRVEGDIIPIENAEPVMRTDMVRLRTGVTDIRYRAIFNNWSMKLNITYVDQLKPEDILSIVNAAGMVGIGEDRPGQPVAKSGTLGTFEVDTNKPIEVRAR